jgi:hypothetical protein
LCGIKKPKKTRRPRPDLGYSSIGRKEGREMITVGQNNFVMNKFIIYKLHRILLTY